MTWSFTSPHRLPVPRSTRHKIGDAWRVTQAPPPSDYLLDPRRSAIGQCFTRLRIVQSPPAQTVRSSSRTNIPTGV